MSEYILKNHENESGIVYCSTKAVSDRLSSAHNNVYLDQHTETIARGLEEVSLGKIKIGVYHADVPDQIKGRLHQHWREGKINVVCATIGMGIHFILFFQMI
jgi:ATP-dependent DNA helicase Q1